MCFPLVKTLASPTGPLYMYIVFSGYTVANNTLLTPLDAYRTVKLLLCIMIFMKWELDHLPPAPLHW